jgi:multidrug efflux pump subunit AcrA (membrane-fusion protein)
LVHLYRVLLTQLTALSRRRIPRIFGSEGALRNYNTRGGVDPEDRDFTQQRDLASQQVEQQIKALLGPERYGDYERSQDGNFRRLAQIAQETGLPRETAVTGYEIQKASREEIQTLQANANLAKAERRQAILDVRKQTDDALRQTLGEEAFKRFKGPERVVKTPTPAQTGPTP